MEKNGILLLKQLITHKRIIVLESSSALKGTNFQSVSEASKTPNKKIFTALLQSVTNKKVAEFVELQKANILKGNVTRFFH